MYFFLSCEEQSGVGSTMKYVKYLLRAVFPVKRSLFRLLVKLHCCIERKEGRKGKGRAGGRKRKKEKRERENVKASLGRQGSAGWLCCCSFQSALLLSDWVRAECQGQEGVLGKSKTV